MNTHVLRVKNPSSKLTHVWYLIVIHICRYLKKIPYVTAILWRIKLEQIIQPQILDVRTLHSYILLYRFLHLELQLDFDYFKTQDIFPLQYVLNISFMPLRLKLVFNACCNVLSE